MKTFFSVATYVRPSQASRKHLREISGRLMQCWHKDTMSHPTECLQIQFIRTKSALLTTKEITHMYRLFLSWAIAISYQCQTNLLNEGRYTVFIRIVSWYFSCTIQKDTGKHNHADTCIPDLCWRRFLCWGNVGKSPSDTSLMSLHKMIPKRM